MEADGIARQVAMGLRAVVPSDSAVFLRTVAATGNDPLLGIRGTEVVTDIAIDPRPSIDCVGLREVALSEGRLIEGDLRMVAAAEQTIAEGMTIVYGGAEYRVVNASAIRSGGRIVAYSSTLRKRVRTDAPS